MSNETVLFIGGIYNLAFVIFHLLFYKIFNWKKDLARITFINSAIMQVLNYSLTFIFLIFAYLSFFYSKEILTTHLGRVLLLSISLFWFFRAIEQIYFFGLKNKTSIAFFIVFIFGFYIYFYLWF